MTRRNYGFTALAALMILLPLAGGCASNKARAEIEAAYAAIDAATTQRSVTQMSSHYAPDFQRQEKGRTVSRQQTQQMMGQVLGVATSAKSKTTVESVEAKGNEATAKGTSHIELVLPTPMTPQPANLVIDDTFEDTWVKNGDKWQLRRSNIVSSKTTVNGKPIPGQ